MEINDILVCREEKSNLIKNYIPKYQVVTLKANIVGSNKNLKEAYILLSYFDLLIPNNYIKKEIIDNSDGPFIIYLFDNNKSMKDDMVLLEQNNELGRFVDIDVYYKNDVSLNRGYLRKCYLCDNPAFVCGRNKTHTLEQLNNYISENVFKFLLKTIDEICNESMYEELNIHPKFGLVTPYSNGSHKDMNYETMEKAIKSIKPFFLEMFKVGYACNNIETIFSNVRKIGITAEKQMFLDTNGINAYKGLIFALGLVVTSTAIKFTLLNQNQTVFDFVKQMCKGICEELKIGSDTYGKKAYQTYGIKGARKEAEEGFSIVKEVINNFKLDNKQSYIEALCYLIYKIDDTVLLKRCNSLEKYYNVKQMFKDFKYDKNKINELNDYCIKNNLSFGGSADLLVVSIFLKKINQKFNLNLFV